MREFRNMIRAISRIVIVILCLSASASAIPMVKPLVGDSIPKHLRHGAVGLKFGFINLGNIHYLGGIYEPDAAVCGGVYFDVPIVTHLLLTAAVDIYDVRVVNVSERFFDISLGFKGWTYSPDTRLALKPGAAIGLGYLADIDFLRPSTYLTLKGFGEVMLFPDSKYAWVFDFGWFWAPYGRVEGEDITVSPSLYVRVGLSL